MIPYQSIRLSLWQALESTEARTLVYSGRYKTRRKWFRLCRYLRSRMARARLARVKGVRP